MTADPLARLREQVARAQCRYFREVVRGERGSGCECEDGDACIQWLGCADAALSLIANSEDAREVVGMAMLANDPVVLGMMTTGERAEMKATDARRAAIARGPCNPAPHGAVMANAPRDRLAASLTRAGFHAAAQSLADIVLGWLAEHEQIEAMDAEIGLAVGIVEITTSGAVNWLSVRRDEPYRRESHSFYTKQVDLRAIAASECLPQFTTSLDSALTLVPADLVRAISFTDWPNVGAHANVRTGSIINPETREWMGHAPNPALALCIAALKATAAPQSPH